MDIMEPNIKSKMVICEALNFDIIGNIVSGYKNIERRYVYSTL